MSDNTIASGRYRHYKGNDYQVLYTARHSESGEWLVVYRCLYDDFSIWVRPYDMFVETVEVDGREVPRFAYIEPMDDFEGDESSSDSDYE